VSDRREVSARGLTPAAVAHLTRDALGTIDFAALGPVKKLLKQYFSDQPWTPADDEALAALVGAGAGWWQYDLDEDLRLEFGWRDGAFRIEVAPRAGRGDTFTSPVVPEATPNPRTIRFVTPPIHDGASRWYDSAAGVDDPRVARLFSDFEDVANILVGPSFVAVGVLHPDRWEQLLDPMLRAITTEFASTTPSEDPLGAPDPESTTTRGAHSRSEVAHGPTALEQAWKELGSLRPDDPEELDRIRAAAASPNTSYRQVAARLFVNAETDLAAAEWGRLLGDPSRSVRRATVDAMVDAGRAALRPLFERAVADTDAWTRWKALRGLVDLGVEPSRAVIAPLAEDPDFRVRLEAATALRL
jgi:Scaffold protein Nfu/NifU N terminal